MSTTLYSEKSIGPRPQWLALGVDAAGRWHNYHTDHEEIVVTDATGIVHRERLDGRPVADWVAYVDDARGWQDHPDATPGRGWLEGATA